MVELVGGTMIGVGGCTDTPRVDVLVTAVASER
jgi:hypothetical protein